ncbi:hypothetical protein ABEB36_003080 [Hypothenemus hampei]|uniref:Uncharacterized protein n=1 Tax=Hypothenemus hampei TaxID=57062 RepID=A0ABD1F7Y9_HYPHA
MKPVNISNVEYQANYDSNYCKSSIFIKSVQEHSILVCSTPIVSCQNLKLMKTTISPITVEGLHNSTENTFPENKTSNGTDSNENSPNGIQEILSNARSHLQFHASNYDYLFQLSDIEGNCVKIMYFTRKLSLNYGFTLNLEESSNQSKQSGSIERNLNENANQASASVGEAVSKHSE